MATLQAAPTRHHHTEQFSGILREGGLGKNTAQKWQARNKPIVSTLCEELQATAYTSHEVPLLEALGHPLRSWENRALLRG